MVVGYGIPEPSSCVPLKELYHRGTNYYIRPSAFASKYGLEQRKRPPEQFPAAFGSFLPKLDNLRNFFFTSTPEMLSFFLSGEAF